jgi:hypothetical protein
LKTEGPSSEQRDRGRRPPDNVVQLFPRDWLGPPDQLVPFGPRATDRSPDHPAAAGSHAADDQADRLPAAGPRAAYDQADRPPAAGPRAAADKPDRPSPRDRRAGRPGSPPSRLSPSAPRRLSGPINGAEDPRELTGKRKRHLAPAPPIAPAAAADDAGSRLGPSPSDTALTREPPVLSAQSFWSDASPLLHAPIGPTGDGHSETLVPLDPAAGDTQPPESATSVTAPPPGATGVTAPPPDAAVGRSVPPPDDAPSRSFPPPPSRHQPIAAVRIASRARQLLALRAFQASRGLRSFRAVAPRTVLAPRAVLPPRAALAPGALGRIAAGAAILVLLALAGIGLFTMPAGRPPAHMEANSSLKRGVPPAPQQQPSTALRVRQPAPAIRPRATGRRRARRTPTPRRRTVFARGNDATAPESPVSYSPTIAPAASSDAQPTATSDGSAAADTSSAPPTTASATATGGSASGTGSGPQGAGAPFGPGRLN